MSLWKHKQRDKLTIDILESKEEKLYCHNSSNLIGKYYCYCSIKTKTAVCKPPFLSFKTVIEIL